MPKYVTLVGGQWVGEADTPLGVPRTSVGSFNLNAPAAAYPLLTASGDVWVDTTWAYVRTASGGLTSITIATDHTTPKSIVASIANASITLDLQMSIVTSAFLLPSGKKISGTIVGTGNAGLIYVMCSWIPVTAGATLA